MLPISQPLLTWLQQPPAAWSRLPLTTRARLRWTSHWNTWNLRLSRDRLPAGRPPEPAPWLILGAWRSGTTVMHELLAAATGLPTPETWQCMSACSFALLGAPPRNVAIARPMDGLQVGPRSPQEDEFALLSMGVDSAYRAFLQPDRLGELAHTLEGAHWLADDGWLASLEAFLALCRLGQAGVTRPMLLKSPNHTFRLQSLLRRWPGAPIVWMLRDPSAVFHSNRKMWRQMIQTHRLDGQTTMPDAALDDFLARALQQCAGQLRWLVQQPAVNWSLCAQEDLQQDPHGAVRRQLDQLAPGQPVDEAALAQALTRTGAGRIERYTGELPAAARAAIDALAAAQAEALDVAARRQALKP